MKKTIILVFALFTTLSAAIAQQKMGHMNSGNVMEKMPEVEKANKVLETLEDSLSVVMDTMTVRFQTKYQKALIAVQEGSLTKVQQAGLEKELAEEQDKISEFQNYAQAAMVTRRQQLLAPLLEKVRNAVNEVGKENGFAYIFDVSTGSMLFAAENSIDVAPMVEAKLGIKS